MMEDVKVNITINNVIGGQVPTSTKGSPAVIRTMVINEMITSKNMKYKYYNINLK